MPAATSDRNTPRREGAYLGFGLAAAALVLAGCFVCYDADGYLVDGANTSGYKFAGVAKEAVDNSAGSDEDETAEIWVTGQFQFASSGLTDADVGERVYLSDNQTVTKTVTNVYVGTIAEISSAALCWVDIDPAGQAAADLDGHLDGTASKHDASEIDVEGGHTNFPDGNLETALGTADTAISANTAHAAGDGSDHADVATNTAHSGGDGSDHADVATNTTHSSGSGSDHADVATNTAHSGGDGSDHADVATNTTHSGGVGSDHADVATNTTHSGGDGSDHGDVAANSADILSLMSRMQNQAMGSMDIDDAIGNGLLSTTKAASFCVSAELYHKGVTNNVWDLSGEADTDADKWRAYWLYLDAAGTGSFGAGSDSAVSEADAISNLPTPAADKAVAGFYVAGNSTDFDGGGGLSGQGTLGNGWPSPLAPTA